MKSYFLNLYRYDRWANSRVLENLKGQDIRDNSIVNLFSHLILAEKIWMMRIKGQDYKNLNFWKALSFSDCETLIPEINDEYFSFINSSSVDDLNNKFEYINSKGITYRNTIADTLTHVAFHSAYHRGQIAKGVRSLKKEPVLTDYIAFIREQ